MSIIQTLQHDQLRARKEKNQVMLGTIQMLLSQIKNEEINLMKRDGLTDEEVFSVMRRFIKQQKDAIIDFEKAEKEKGEDEKRESNEWIIDESKINKKYSIVKKKQKSQLELRSTTPVNLSPFFKNEVNKYFNSLIKENND